MQIFPEMSQPRPPLLFFFGCHFRVGIFPWLYHAGFFGFCTLWAIDWYVCKVCIVHRIVFFFFCSVIVELIVSFLLLSIIQNRIEQIYGWSQIVVWSTQWPQSVSCGCLVRYAILFEYHLFVLVLLLPLFERTLTSHIHNTHTHTYTDIVMDFPFCLPVIFSWWPTTLWEISFYCFLLLEIAFDNT